MSKRILTGDRPTGPLHLGHYVGSLVERLRFQNQENTECFFIIADYQVMTDRLDTRDVEKNILEVAMDYLAVGIDPLRSTIFIQSRVPQLAELFMYFSMLVSMSKVGRNPTVKEEVKSAGLGSTMSLGMFSYPVSQAADILLFQANYVPVGEDQLPHIEMTRGIAKTFNRLYGDTFTVPEAVVSNIPRLLGLDANQKMSKSRKNAIYLSDTPDDIKSKIKTAVTDSDTEIRFDLKEKPAISNLLIMYQTASGLDMQEVEAYFSGKGYGFLKQQLTDVLIAFLGPIRAKRQVYKSDLGLVAKILCRGTSQAIAYGEETMTQVRSAVNYNFPNIYR